MILAQYNPQGTPPDAYEKPARRQAVVRGSLRARCGNAAQHATVAVVTLLPLPSLKKIIQGQVVSLKVGSNFQDSFSQKLVTFQERSE